MDINKPVAWVTQKALDDLRIPLISEITLRIAVKSKNTDPFNIPLYTHPVKELTDEEIHKVWDEVMKTRGQGNDLNKFARAILRKAQEK